MSTSAFILDENLSEVTSNCSKHLRLVHWAMTLYSKIYYSVEFSSLVFNLPRKEWGAWSHCSSRDSSSTSSLSDLQIQPFHAYLLINLATYFSMSPSYLFILLTPEWYFHQRTRDRKIFKGGRGSKGCIEITILVNQTPIIYFPLYNQSAVLLSLNMYFLWFRSLLDLVKYEDSC